MYILGNNEINQLGPPASTPILNLYRCIILYIEIISRLGFEHRSEYVVRYDVPSLHCITDGELSNDEVAITGNYFGKVPLST